MGVQLTAQQQEAVVNRGGSLLVSAAAGSGKTKVLVKRLFRYITEEGKNVTDFLIITYTKAAAAELRMKIAEELTELQRQTLVAYYFQEQTMAQIARDRGVNKSTVSRTLHRAEGNLRRFLKY